MSEQLTYLLGALPILIAVGWYCRRWGIDDGYADGYEKGRTVGLLEGKGLVVAIDKDGSVHVSPQGGGGPGVPEK